MSGRARAIATVLLAGLFAWRGAAARDEANGCREMPVPDGAKLLYVASDMSMNGIPMGIKEMRSKDSPDAVLAFYRNAWGGKRPGYFETPVEDWRTIATYEGRCYYSVQVRPQGNGTYALLGVTRRPDVMPKAPGAGFPMLMGSTVFNDLSHRDGPKSARTVLIGNPRSIQENATFYRQTLETQGWVSFVDKAVVTDKGPAQVMLWRRGLEELSVTVQRAGPTTTVVANLVDQP